MANVFGGRIWTLDTIGVICTYPVKITSIQVLAAAAVAGSAFTIIDPVTAQVLWGEIATGANFAAEDVVDNWWRNGFQLSTLSGVAGASVIVSLA